MAHQGLEDRLTTQIPLHLGEHTVLVSVATAFSEGVTIENVLLHDSRWKELGMQTPAAVCDWTHGFGNYGYLVNPAIFTTSDKFLGEHPSGVHLGGAAIVMSSLSSSDEVIHHIHAMEELLRPSGAMCVIEKQPGDFDLSWREQLFDKLGFARSTVGSKIKKEWIITHGRLPKMAHHEPKDLFEWYENSRLLDRIKQAVAKEYQKLGYSVESWSTIDAHLHASTFIPHDLRMLRRGWGTRIQGYGGIWERDLLGEFNEIEPTTSDSVSFTDFEVYIPFHRSNRKEAIEVVKDAPPPLEPLTECGECGGPRNIVAIPEGEDRPGYMRYFMMRYCNGDCPQPMQYDWQIDVPL
jgi:hypothetical protein